MGVPFTLLCLGKAGHWAGHCPLDNVQLYGQNTVFTQKWGRLWKIAHFYLRYWANYQHGQVTRFILTLPLLGLVMSLMWNFIDSINWYIIRFGSVCNTVTCSLGTIIYVIDIPLFSIWLIAILFPLYINLIRLVRYPVSWPCAWVKYTILSNFSYKSHRKYFNI